MSRLQSCTLPDELLKSTFDIIYHQGNASQNYNEHPINLIVIIIIKKTTVSTVRDTSHPIEDGFTQKDRS